MTARNGWWVATLSALFCGGAGLYAQEGVWRPAAAVHAPGPASQGPLVTLDRPVPLDAPASAEPKSEDPSAPLGILYRAAYRDGEESASSPPYIARGQPPDAVPPPVVGPPPPPPVEGFNQGAITDQPLRRGWWDKCKDFFNHGDHASANCRCTFQSDHAFDCMISPVSDPFLFEDPRALTEVRPIFIYQEDPHAHGGGSSGFFGTQARLALTEHWSFVINELGFVYFDPNSAPPHFSSTTSFAQVSLGPKWTFYRNPDSGTVLATGLNFVIPAGNSKAFQDTGTLSLFPYLSAAQHMRLPQGYGGLNFMGTTGYSISVDDQRSEYFYLGAHVDYDIAGLNKIFPLLELNYYHYTSGGKGPALGFEGADLANLGSSSLGKRDYLTLAPGIRYKFNEAVQAGFAIEFPLTTQKELTNYRLTFDLIFRY